jgi:hypothetical protein
MAIKELIIDRARWGQSALLNKDGTMCCLGFLSKACGVHDEVMLDVALPRFDWIKEYNINKEFGIGTALAIDRASAAGAAAKINDDNSISKSEKETKLIELFAKNNINLSFIGEHRA